MPPVDLRERPLRNLRLSVTDRCNLRCAYCMPEQEYVWLPHRDILGFEELDRLVDVFLDLGVDKVRLTGGEPLLRRDLPVLVGMLAAKDRLRDLAMTTNGVLLERHAADLKRAGLHRLTVSLDTLRPDRFRALTRRDDLARALAGLDAARAAGFDDLKIDTVVMRGVNDDEIEPLIAHAAAIGAELRFIEYMDVGGATRWSPDAVVTRAELLERLVSRHGAVEGLPKDGWAPADRFRFADGTVVGIIASTSRPFCGTCDRSRLTADGLWYLCLYARKGIDLRGPLRDGATAAELADLIAASWRARDDRGAEERAALGDRGRMHEAAQLRADPHLEMHTRGG